MNKIKELWQKIVAAYQTKKWLKWVTIGAASAVLVAAVTIGLVLGLNGGKSNENSGNSADPTCNHVWEETSRSGSTCAVQGKVTYTCENCDGTKTEKLPLLSHTFENGACVDCGEIQGSKGLSYVLSDSGEYYIVDGKGSCWDKELFIPNQYEGKPVKEIAAEAFRNNQRLQSVSIGSAVEKIGDYAFYWNENLTSLTFYSALKEVGTGAFNGCTALEKVDYQGALADWCGVTFAEESNPLEYAKNLSFKGEIPKGEVVIPSGVTAIPAYTFRNAEVTSFSIPDSVISIGVDAFANTAFYNNSANWQNGVLYRGKHLLAANKEEVVETYTVKEGTFCIADNAFAHCKIMKIELSQSLTSIGAQAFLDTSLQEIELGENLRFIGVRAFDYCDALKSVTFKSPDGWAADNTPIESEKLSDAATAKTYLVMTYKEVSWKRAA